MGKKLTGFSSAVIVAVIAIAIAVYYLIPGIAHPRFMGGTTTGPAKAIAIFFFVVALGAAIVAVVMRPRKHKVQQ
jgi:hypothetical protein